jgi:hypothetical protein
VVVNAALAELAVAPRGVGPHVSKLGQGLPPDEVVVLEQEPIRRLFQLPNAAILELLHRAGERHPGVAGYAALLRDALGGFVPDVTVSVTPAGQLRGAFPEALVLRGQPAAYSRAPFEPAFFLDPRGHWDRSIPALHAAALLEHEASAAELELLQTFRARFTRYLRAISPFAPLFAELRERHRAVGLLPLQFAGEPAFDCNAPFRGQAEYLFHVVENLPRDLALIVAQHPTARWLGDFLDEDCVELVTRRHPNVRFVDAGAAENAGQLLLPDADFVISVSSSLGQQALLFGKPLVAVGTSHLVPFAAVRGVEQLPAAGPLPAPDPRLDRALAWLMTRYFLPAALCKRAAWLAPFLERGVARHRAGDLGIDFYEPIAPLDELRGLIFRTLDTLTATALRGRLDNGDFARWSRGAIPDGWELLDFGGGVATVARAAGAAAIRRTRAGSGPTFFLSRVPGAASCAGAMARLRFRAKSVERCTVHAYLFVQADDGRPCLGTPAQPFALGPEWRELAHVARVPPLDGRTPGPASHVEVVFMLPPEAGATSFEVADVVLEDALA